MADIARVAAIQAVAFFAAACYKTIDGYVKQTDKNIPYVKSYLKYSGICMVFSLVFLVISKLI